jgi:hypothetical protein
MNLCTYCPNPATTKDHVPPECLFAKPLPDDLVMVPSCYECNHGATEDDEYFRLMVAMNRKIDHPDARAGRHSSVRSLVRIEAPGLRSTFLSSVQDDEVLSPAGLYLGNVVTYKANPLRLCRVAERVTFGLRYHETGQRFEADYQAITLLPEAVDMAETRAKLLHDARNLQRLGKPGVTARKVLAFWWHP